MTPVLECVDTTPVPSFISLHRSFSPVAATEPFRRNDGISSRSWNPNRWMTSKCIDSRRASISSSCRSPFRVRPASSRALDSEASKWILNAESDEGVKTISPHMATAKLDSRLPPNIRPDEALDKIRKHLDDDGFGDIQIRKLSGYPSSQTSVEAPLVEAVIGVFNK